ncbi:hypothetical protein [Photobacterium nomapromontoriensis]|uniref:hypothetical protein n=1 Tax=Photobacterium nomapromontoriensis TaxID=2910237 RepID=UPI003D0B7859
MTTLSTFEKTLLKTVAERRKIGKPGLSLDLIRDAQVKIRFTDSEREVVKKIAQSAADTTEAQFVYTLAISAVRDMMIADPQIAEQIKTALIHEGISIPDWMSELCHGC